LRCAAFLQAIALEQLHYDERRLRRFVQLMDRADAGMVERRSGARLAPEPLQRGSAVAAGFGKQLDGDVPAKLLVDRLIDPPMPP
jgi:hypothetical protein